MRILIATVVLLFIICYPISAQDTANPEYYENKSFNLFISKNWAELIEIIDSAFDNNINSFFLSLRYGIARFELGEYMIASDYLESALNYRKNDLTALKYLYSAYLYSGRDYDAYKVGLQLNKNANIITGLKEKEFIDGIYVEGGYIFNSSYNDALNNYLKPQVAGSTSGYQKILKNYNYGSLIISHRITNSLSVNHGPVLFRYNYTEQFLDNNRTIRNFSVHTDQFDYYLNFRLHPSSGFEVGLAGHYMNVGINSVNPDYIPGNSYRENKRILNDYVIALQLSKYFSNFRIGLEGSVSSLNDAEQFQNGLFIGYYPFSNLNLYLFNNTVLHAEKENGKNKRNYTFNLINNFTAGFRIADYLWLEAGFSVGNIANYNEGLGFIVYNNVDRIRRRFNLNLILPVNNNITAYLRYQNHAVDHQYNINTESITYNNNNQILIGGMKWNF